MTAKAPLLPLPRVELRATELRFTGLLTLTVRGLWLHWSHDGGATFTRGHERGSLFLYN